MTGLMIIILKQKRMMTPTGNDNTVIKVKYWRKIDNITTALMKILMMIMMLIIIIIIITTTTTTTTTLPLSLLS